MFVHKKRHERFCIKFHHHGNRARATSDIRISAIFLLHCGRTSRVTRVKVAEDHRHWSTMGARWRHRKACEATERERSRMSKGRISSFSVRLANFLYFYIQIKRSRRDTDWMLVSLLWMGWEYQSWTSATEAQHSHRVINVGNLPKLFLLCLLFSLAKKTIPSASRRRFDILYSSNSNSLLQYEIERKKKV